LDVKDVPSRVESFVKFENVLAAKRHEGIDNVGVKGLKPRPIGRRDATAYARRNETESTAPTAVAIGEDAVQDQIGVVSVFDKEGYSNRPWACRSSKVGHRFSISLPRVFIIVAGGLLIRRKPRPGVTAGGRAGRVS
jgi:hypothetical protein